VPGSEEVGIAFEMYSFLLRSLSCVSSEDFYSNTDHHLFIEGFRKCDIATLILCCAAGHPPVPENADGELLAQCRAEFSDKIPQVNREMVARVDHSRCTADEYNRVANLAQEYGIFHHNRKSDRSTPVRFQVSHVKIVRANIMSTREIYIPEYQPTHHTALAAAIPAHMKNNRFFNATKQGLPTSVDNTFCGFRPGFLIGKRF